MSDPTIDTLSQPAPPDAPAPLDAPAPPPPANLPADAQAFYRAGGDLDALAPVAQPEPKHVLEQLGPPPFRKTSFPMMGFLASLYEHISQHVSPRK